MKSTFSNIPIYQSLNQYLEHYFNSDSYHSAIPMLEKKEIVDRFPHNYMTDRVKQAINDGDIEYASTSGTSSEKLMLIRPADWWKDEFQRGYKYCPTMVGYSMHDNKKTCLSTAVCSANTCFMDNPGYEERIIGNTLYLNAQPDPYLWTKEDVIKIGKEMRAYAAELLEVDPVYLAIYLKKRQDFGVEDELFQPKFITCSYEFLTQEHRDYIRKFFYCPVLSLYGSTELGVLFIQNESETFYRCPERSIVELVPLDEGRRLYELVVTSWKNEFMPFLRYRTKDIVEIAEEDQKFYRREKKIKFMEYEPLKISKLHGRINDAFYTDKGELVTVGMLDEKIQQCNIVPWQYQLEINLDRVVFRFIFLESNPSSFSSEKNFSFLREWFPSVPNIDLVKTNSLRNEGSGKYRLISGNNLKNRGH